MRLGVGVEYVGDAGDAMRFDRGGARLGGLTNA